MKILIGFVLGVMCGVAAMFYLPARLLASPDTPRGVVGTRHAAPMVASVGTASVPPSISSASVATMPAQAVVVEAAPLPDTTVMTASSTLPIAVSAPADMADLPPSAVSGLLIPVVGVKAGDLVDTFTQARGTGRVHDAIDIMAARGTPVVAANDGHVVKLFTSEPGGLTVYEFDTDNRVIYYYAHLDGYAAGLVEGQVLHRGDPVGFVGSTGNASADAPHLHFEVQILGPEKQWWHATSINPYGLFEQQQPVHATSASLP